MDRTLSNNIAKFRKARQMSQDILAGRLNMSVTQLSRLERGTSSLTQQRIMALSTFFGVEPHELFNDAITHEGVELNVMRDVIVQLDEMLARMAIHPTPQQRADLTIELYRLETNGVPAKDLPRLTVRLKKYEGMLRSMLG